MGETSRKIKMEKLPHDILVGRLESKLEKWNNLHRVVLTEHEFDYNGHHEADVIVLDRQRRYAYAIEVKTRNHYKARRKARKQLDADEDYIKNIFHIDRVFKFYAYWDRRKPYHIERIWT